MELLKIGHRNQVVARILSAEVWTLRTHWIQGRTMLCPSIQCPACKMARGKLRAYAIAEVKGPQAGSSIGLIELSEDAITALQQRGLQLDAAHGWSWKMVKRLDRPGWNVLAASRGDHAPVDRELIANHLETLYGLPARLVDEDEHLTDTSAYERSAWLAAYATVLRRRLIHALNPGQAQ